jgi:ABC-type uncharacterized transport system substrate-binding protein
VAGERKSKKTKHKIVPAEHDPIGSGFVALARPGGNVTGFTTVEGSLAAHK